MRRHDFDPTPLVAGAVFLAVAAAYFLDASGAWNLSGLAALVFTLVGLGATAATAAVNRSIRARRGRRPDGPPAG